MSYVICFGALCILSSNPTVPGLRVRDRSVRTGEKTAIGLSLDIFKSSLAYHSLWYHTRWLECARGLSSLVETLLSVYLSFCLPLPYIHPQFQEIVLVSSCEKLSCGICFGSLYSDGNTCVTFGTR